MIARRSSVFYPDSACKLIRLGHEDRLNLSRRKWCMSPFLSGNPITSVEAMRLNRARLTWHSFLGLVKWAGLITAVAVVLAVMRGVNDANPFVIVARIFLTFAVVVAVLALFQLGVTLVRRLSQRRSE